MTAVRNACGSGSDGAIMARDGEAPALAHGCLRAVDERRCVPAARRAGAVAVAQVSGSVPHRRALIPQSQLRQVVTQRLVRP